MDSFLHMNIEELLPIEVPSAAKKKQGLSDLPAAAFVSFETVGQVTIPNFENPFGPSLTIPRTACYDNKMKVSGRGLELVFAWTARETREFSLVGQNLMDNRYAVFQSDCVVNTETERSVDAQIKLEW